MERRAWNCGKPLRPVVKPRHDNHDNWSRASGTGRRGSGLLHLLQPTRPEGLDPWSRAAGSAREGSASGSLAAFFVHGHWRVLKFAAPLAHVLEFPTVVCGCVFACLGLSRTTFSKDTGRMTTRRAPRTAPDTLVPGLANFTGLHVDHA